MRVRALDPKDETDWRRLWALYLASYETHLPEAVTLANWDRLMREGSGVIGLVAEARGAVVGLAHVIIHPNTWSAGDICYLEDLVVEPAARGGRVGEALIRHIIDLCRTRGWARLYWVTRADNVPARRLYDRFTAADDFVRYRLDPAVQ